MILALDQGLSGTGFAFFEGGLLKQCGNWYPETTVLYIEVNKPDWVLRSERFVTAILRNIDIKFTDLGVQDIIMERPAFHGSDAGQTVARSGSLVTLCYFSGMLHGALKNEKFNITSIPVMSWKGQLPKDVVAKRVWRNLEKQGVKIIPKAHAIDAVGIGMYHLGDF